MANEKYRIKGYKGQHDEDGAKIIDDEGNVVCWTPSVSEVGGFKNYYKNNNFVIKALNVYWEKCQDEIEENSRRIPKHFIAEGEYLAYGDNFYDFIIVTKKQGILYYESVYTGKIGPLYLYDGKEFEKIDKSKSQFYVVPLIVGYSLQTKPEGNGEVLKIRMLKTLGEALKLCEIINKALELIK